MQKTHRGQHKRLSLSFLLMLLGWLGFLGQMGYSEQSAQSAPLCASRCISSKQGKSLALKPLQFHYEIDGHFDKDEQGWCASHISIQIWPNGKVLLRDWYDANGHILSDLHYRGHVIAQYGQTLTLQLEGRGFLAHLEADPWGRVRLDLQTGRLKAFSD
jgi:hypothetical protein